MSGIGKEVAEFHRLTDPRPCVDTSRDYHPTARRVFNETFSTSAGIDCGRPRVTLQNGRVDSSAGIDCGDPNRVTIYTG